MKSIFKILFTIASKIINYLGINLTKKLQELYTEIQNTWLKEIKEDLNKRHPVLMDWNNVNNNNVKMAIFSKLVYRFNVIPIKIPNTMSAEKDKLILKFIWNCKRTLIGKTSLKKKNKVGGLLLPDFKLTTKLR